MTVDASSSSAYPRRDTSAATMLAAGFEQTTASRKISLRQLGKKLGYKQAVALSHMAKGRIPISIERATQLSEALGFDQGTFLMAILEQRYPMVS
ncbi:helix-turn-helix domain-containing protein [Sphingomonas bacterium]|uniref:helix-turn-helix domain-containing protein n=1 Tax=Sphingomonas bacterium TaxID=1895847 RepID=UPI00157649DA|nr:helix-turn-helix transcriptional regulator [Sphingomonas bacterium]